MSGVEITITEAGVGHITITEAGPVHLAKPGEGRGKCQVFRKVSRYKVMVATLLRGNNLFPRIINPAHFNSCLFHFAIYFSFSIFNFISLYISDAIIIYVDLCDLLKPEIDT